MNWRRTPANTERFPTETGRVTIAWEIDEQGAFSLVWREHGGPPVAYPQRRGFGSRLLERGLAVELAGKVRLDFEPGGVVCTITARLTKEQPA